MPRRFPTLRRALPRALVPLTLLVVALAACGEGSTAPGTGRLVVTVAALRPDVPAAITVSGPGGFTATVVATDTLEGLRPGSYVVAGAAVTAGGARYQPTPASMSVDVVAGAVAVAEPVAYALTSGRLVVGVGGLPAGVAAVLSVTGPSGFARTLTAGSTLDLLEPGEYTVTALDVSSGSRVYRGDPATARATVGAAAAPESLAVWYGAGTGTLAVEITGVPDGVSARVDVRGPDGYARTLTAGASLARLEPGTYDVAARPTGRDLVTYRPVVASRSVVVTTAGASVSVAHAAEPLALTLVPAAEGFAAPVFVTAPAGDRRLFVVERSGRVVVVRDGTPLGAAFIDIGARVNGEGERGLLGMAFDPAYETSGEFFLYYVARDGAVVLERFASVPGSDVASGSRGEVMRIPHGGSEHHGGMLAFGPDGMLYLAPGDGGCCGDPDDDAQRPSSLLGKMLRIDVRRHPYVVPPSNPFFSRTDTRPEIWALGLRSPWRFSFDPAEGLLYLADVGENSREEINVSATGAAGLNYGWRRMEGTACFVPASGCAGGGLTLPAIEYLHAEGCSVIGGYAYRGAEIPELTARFFYTDYCRGWLRSFRYAGGAAGERRQWEGITLTRVTSFGVDGAGELYLVGPGAIWRLARR